MSGGASMMARTSIKRQRSSPGLTLPLWYPKLMRAERAVSTPDSLVYVVAAATILLKLVMTVT